MQTKYIETAGLAAAMLMASSAGALAASGHKSPRDCNSELYARQGAIQAAGETPAQFVHECWAHSQPGKPMPLAGSDPINWPHTSRMAAALPDGGPHRHAVSTIVDARRLARAERQVARATPAAHPKRVAWRNDRVIGQIDEHHRVRRQFAANEAFRRRRDLTTEGVPDIWDDRRPNSRARELRAVAASLGPSARVGRRIWVQVATATDVRKSRALSVGGLSEESVRPASLNCWGQPVLFVGRTRTHWSRSMVCDGRPAGANEWAATISYRGPDAIR